MPSFQIRVNVNSRGPMTDGRAQRALRDYTDQVDYRVATEAENLVLDRLGTSIKNRTPYYETRVGVERSSRGGYEVTDHGVIYGHWLEGTGSRNYPVTRFRGYRAFSRARALIQTRAPGIARRLLARYTSRM
ncbi:hypothetical protein [Streptomyces tauricus]|uniref:hypothetical protein n=1 Tax=Streptomyces tauricus TaxID=68274 RepID=UPI003444EED1